MKGGQLFVEEARDKTSWEGAGQSTPHCTLLHHTALITPPHFILLHFTLHHTAPQQNALTVIALHSTPHCTQPHHTALRLTSPHHPGQHPSMPHYTTWHRTTPHCISAHHTTPPSSWRVHHIDNYVCSDSFCYSQQGH